MLANIILSNIYHGSEKGDEKASGKKTHDRPADRYEGEPDKTRFNIDFALSSGIRSSGNQIEIFAESSVNAIGQLNFHQHKFHGVIIFL